MILLSAASLILRTRMYILFFRQRVQVNYTTGLNYGFLQAIFPRIIVFPTSINFLSVCMLWAAEAVIYAYSPHHYLCSHQSVFPLCRVCFSYGLKTLRNTNLQHFSFSLLFCSFIASFMFFLAHCEKLLFPAALVFHC